MHMFQEASGSKYNIVPFSGDGPSWQAALAGHVDASSNNLGIVYGQVKAGALRALAVMTDKRSPFLPDVPTFKELGYDVHERQCPRVRDACEDPRRQIVDKFAAAVKEVMDSPEFKENAAKTAFPSDYMGRRSYAAYMTKLGEIYRPLWDKYGKEAAAPK